MIFSDPTDKGGIVEEIDFLCGTKAATYPLDHKVRNVNRGLDKVVAIILGADGRWQWDDTNYTDYPIATTDLVSGQKNYKMASDFLDITRVEWLDSNGNWIKGTPLDQRDIKVALEEFHSTNGTPLFYDKLSDSLALYPAPNYNSTDGLKVYYQRVVSYFSDTDTTKVPGFANQFHRILSLYATKDYALTKKPQILPQINNEIALLEREIQDFYGQRSKDEAKKIKPVTKLSI
jgi:hypothetical protein